MTRTALRRLGVRVGGRSRWVRVGRARTRAGRRVRVKLHPRVRRALGGRRGARLRVHARIVTADGRTTTARRSLTLRDRAERSRRSRRR